ncbi:MAG: SIS domain-containing protein, partial [Bacillota bacterium]
PIAEELSLKIIETSYKLSKCYSIAEFAHGPYALVERGTTVILLAPDGKFKEDFAAMAAKLKKDGAKVIVITDVKQIYNCLSDDGILLPNKKDSQVFLFILAAQVYAAYMSKACGNNPDKPRGLNKVTLTI